MTVPVINRPGRSPRTRARVAFSVAILAALSLAMVAAAAPAGAHRGHRECKWQNAHPSQVGVALVRRAVLCLINHERQAHGLPALRASGTLDNSAQSWANTMVATGNSGGGDLASEISNYNWSQAGQVVGSGFPTAARIVTGWMGDPGHCEVILDPVYRAVGTGVNVHSVAGFYRKGATFTQDYALAMGQRPASENWGPADHC